MRFRCRFGLFLVGARSAACVRVADPNGARFREGKERKGKGKDPLASQRMGTERCAAPLRLGFR